MSNDVLNKKDFSNKNLQKASFRAQDLAYASFVNSDLRGADFSHSDLTGADLTHVRTGIIPINIIWMFIGALAASVLSGYVAMLAGQATQVMFASNDSKIRASGILTIVFTVVFIVYFYLKGGSRAIRYFVIPLLIIAAIIGIIANVSGISSGRGMFYQVIALALVVLMFIIGTIARAAAGSLSNILFIVVALSGGLFSKSVGGGIGTAIMAISCALISKRALSGTHGFDFLKSIACRITSQFGTSFRHARLTNANFSESRIRNADFSNATIGSVDWGKSKKNNCIINEDDR
jgi:hypothetical protein